MFKKNLCLFLKMIINVLFFSFFLRFLRYFRALSMEFLAAFCKTTFLMLQVTSQSAGRLSSIQRYIGGLITVPYSFLCFQVEWRYIYCSHSNIIISETRWPNGAHTSSSLLLIFVFIFFNSGLPFSLGWLAPQGNGALSAPLFNL